MSLRQLLELKNTNLSIVLIGASILGKLAYNALKIRGYNNVSFFDSDERKQGKEFYNKTILNFDQLTNLPKETIFVITHNYINSTTALLKEIKFTNIFNSVELFENTDFSKMDINLSEWESKHAEDEIAFHKIACEKIYNKKSDVINLKCIDIIVTEKCSMKCKDCSNLMQYYIKPVNSEIEPLFKNLDKLMSSVDFIYEFRVLGGEPFMNKELYKVLNRLDKYKNARQIVIYTNATILPKNENFEVLKNKKITLEITDYGKLSRKTDELVAACKEANINYRAKPPVDWTACGTLKYYERSKEELTRMFDNCCMREVPQMLHGVIYKCPFAANATNLKAVPYKDDEVVNLNDEKQDEASLRKKMKDFNNIDKPLTACSYCGGRDYKSQSIVEPALQS
jgi:organic radical activating enzyme